MTRDSAKEPIAIIGMACRLPGAGDPEALWQLLVNRRDAVGEYPGGRTPELDSFYRQVGMPEGPSSGRGGFVPDIDRFDSGFFEISPREAEWLDPQQRILLEVTWEALENAGLSPERMTSETTGVFSGVWANDYERHCTANAPVSEFFLITGGPLYGNSSRVSYQLDLGGPDVCVSAACASSLVATHVAVNSLRTGECSLALVGGANVLVRHELTQALSRAGMLSPDGSCKFADASADGFVRSDGFGVLVLKRLSDAQRDGDHILALIRGTGLANDGRGSGLLVTPSVTGQRKAILEAVQNAEIDPTTVDFVQVHGTGTRAGDPVEIAAVSSVYGRKGEARTCRVSSLKSNIGHTEAAAGVASIIATVQALRNAWVPASLHVRELNPAIPWEETGLSVERHGSAWEGGASPRRAAVHGLGLTGTNAHVVLEEAPECERDEPTPAPAVYLLPLSAASDAALRRRALDLEAHLGALGEDAQARGELADLCYTAAVRRKHMEHRLSVVGTSAKELRQRLEAFGKGQQPAWCNAGQVGHGTHRKVAFVFPGQGSQWVGMGRELLATNAMFRRYMEVISAEIENETGWSVLQQLEDPALEDRLSRIDVVQPTLFAMQVALAQLWMSCGVVPDAVVGHSMGEVAAAVIAGALPVSSAVQIICRRSRLLTRVAGQGGMLVVDLPKAEAESLIAGREDQVAVAVCNSSRSTVLAGAPAALEAISAELEDRDVFFRAVRVDVASHSPQMDPLLEDLFAALDQLASGPTLTPLCSTVKARFLDGEEMDRSYWVSNLREPVLFSTAVELLVTEGFDTFIEMSPHPILLPFVQQVGADAGRNVLAVGSLQRNEPEVATMLGSLGRLFTVGTPVEWAALYPKGKLVSLPAYPWQRDRFWMRSAEKPTAVFGSATGHPLAGDPVRAATGEWIWNQTIAISAHDWLKDHAVGKAVLLPASAYAEFAGAIGKNLFGTGSTRVSQLSLTRTAALSAEGVMDWQAIATPASASAFSVKFFAREPGAEAWTATAECRVERSSGLDWPRPEPALWEDAEFTASTETGAKHVARMVELGYNFGPAFQQVEWLKLDEDAAIASVAQPRNLRRQSYLLHPAVVDAAFQVLGRALIEMMAEPAVLLPVRLEGVEWTGLSTDAASLRVRVTVNPGSLSGDVELFDPEGRLLVSVGQLTFQQLEPEKRSQVDSLQKDLYEPSWQELPFQAANVAAQRSGSFLLVAESPEMAMPLGAALEARGHLVRRLAEADLAGAALPAGEAVRDVVWLAPLAPEHWSSLERSQDMLARGARLAASLEERSAELSSPARIWVLTCGTRAVAGSQVRNVLGAGMWGLFASVGNEYPNLRASCVDLPEGFSQVDVDALANLLLSDPEEDRVALRDGRLFAERLRRFDPERHPLPRVPLDQLRSAEGEDEAFELVQRVAGSVDSMELVACSRRAPGEDEIEIAVEASGMNFMDVLGAFGFEASLSRSRMGGECAGTVVRVGSAVRNLQPGDAVLAITPSFRKQTLFANRVIVPARLAAKKPATMSFAKAAGIPCVFLTAWYGLLKLARLEPGERVLIHAAAGGVGLAAIQIAQWRGAEVYATVGSEEKRAFLRTLGIKNIMNSRTLDFGREVMEATGGKGVDVVLNSLAGPAIAMGLECLAPYGRFVEIGKKDILENSKVGLQPFQKNLSLFAVDLAQSVEDRREMMGQMLEEVMALFQEGVLRPEPVTRFPISEASSAFHLMATGGHIGKVVLLLRDQGASVRRNPARLSGAATYLITGGTGGLGLVTARSLLDLGARNLVLCARRAPSAEAMSAIRRMEDAGATVSVRQLDFASEAEVDGLFREIGAMPAPLRGIVHAAGVLDDGVVADLSPARFAAVFGGKVAGALAMEDQVSGLHLDFLVYFSSIAGVLGNPGQGNYAAASTVLDTLAHHQRSRGIPAVSIDWGTWAEVGLAAQRDVRGERLNTKGLQAFSPSEGATLFASILEWMPAQVAAVNLDVDRWCDAFPAAERSGFLTELRRSTEAGAGEVRSVRDTLSALEGHALLEALTAWIREQVAAVLRLDVKSVALDKPVRLLGLDSLMALELRNRLERHLAIKLSATLVWNHPTVTAMAAHLAPKLASAPKVQQEPEPRNAKAARARDLEEMPVPATFAVPEGISVAEALAAELFELEVEHGR